MTDLLEELKGQAVLVTTVGRIYVGRLVAWDPSHLKLADASWVADVGQPEETLRTGNLPDVQRYRDPAYVGRGVISDLTLWRHNLPTRPQ